MKKIREFFTDLFLPEVHYELVPVHRFTDETPAGEPLCGDEGAWPLMVGDADAVTCEACREELRRATR